MVGSDDNTCWSAWATHSMQKKVRRFLSIVELYTIFYYGIASIFHLLLILLYFMKIHAQLALDKRVHNIVNSREQRTEIVLFLFFLSFRHTHTHSLITIHKIKDSIVEMMMLHLHRVHSTLHCNKTLGFILNRVNCLYWKLRQAEQHKYRAADAA